MTVSVPLGVTLHAKKKEHMGTYVNSKELVEKAIYSEGKKKIFLSQCLQANTL